MRTSFLATAAFLLIGSGIHAAESPYSLELRETLEDTHAKGKAAEHWIYNDFDAAVAEARKTGKPIFVTFRCVPCAACAGFDAEVAQGSDIIREMARKHFVSLRIVEMKGVDLNLFQFDYDLNWAAMFLNADRVIYGRYGTQSAEGPDAYNSVASLKRALERVLELHRNYPANQPALEGKHGPKKPYRTALEMPGLPRKEQYAATTSRRNCIHCHNIHDAETFHAFDQDAFSNEMLWRYPLPENVGMKIVADDGRRVKAVLPGSPASAAGLRAGDEIMAINRQPIVSIADIQWVLHNLPNTDATFEVSALRDRQPLNLTIATKGGWKRTDISWRGSMWNVPPRLRIWTPEVTAKELKEAGLPADARALKAKWINTNMEGGRAARDAGLKTGDFIIALDGKPLPDTARQFHTHLKLNYKVGKTLPLTLWREGRKIDISIPLVE